MEVDASVTPAEPLPRLRALAEIPKVPEVVSVAKEEAVIVLVLPKVKVAAVLSVPSEVAFKVEVPVKLTVPALMVRMPLVVPLFGLIVILPVVAPPIVSVLLFKAWRDPLPLATKPVVPDPFCAEIEATGVAAPALPVKANFALAVDVPPRRTSKVVLLVVIAPMPADCQ